VKIPRPPPQNLGFTTPRIDAYAVDTVSHHWAGILSQCVRHCVPSREVGFWSHGPV